MNKIVFATVKDFKEYIYTVIECSYQLGMAYERKPPDFSPKEAIKRFQDGYWEDLKKLWNIEETENEVVD